MHSGGQVPTNVAVWGQDGYHVVSGLERGCSYYIRRKQRCCSKRAADGLSVCSDHTALALERERARCIAGPRQRTGQRGGGGARGGSRQRNCEQITTMLALLLLDLTLHLVVCVCFRVSANAASSVAVATSANRCDTDAVVLRLPADFVLLLLLEPNHAKGIIDHNAAACVVDVTQSWYLAAVVSMFVAGS